MIGFFAFLAGILLFFALLYVVGVKLVLPKIWLVAPFLLNDLKNPKKFFCFTKVKPGELKVVVRGDNVVGYIMNMPEKSLRRDKDDPTLTINNDAFADVIEEKADTTTDDLFYWVKTWRRMWESVYEKSGCVFVGIPPWQTLGHRPFRSAHLSEDRSSISYTEGVTDHMRVREFARPFIVKSVETREGLKMSLGIEITFETTNGFRQWHAVDRVELRLDNIVPARMQEFVKTNSVEAIVTSDIETARLIEEYLIGKESETVPGGVLKSALDGYGLRAKKAHVFLLDPEFSEEEKQAFTAKWRAEKRKDARKVDAEADANYLTMTSAPLKDNEGLVRVEVAKAAASGKGVTTVIMEGGLGSRIPDPAGLAELQRIRENKKEGSK